jgi:hypothetical protein
MIVDMVNKRFESSIWLYSLQCKRQVLFWLYRGVFTLVAVGTSHGTGQHRAIKRRPTSLKYDILLEG